MKTIIGGIYVIALLVSPHIAFGQLWEGFSLRKAFDGTKNEEEPAAVTFVDPGEGEDFYRIDLAFKITQWNPKLKGPDLLVYPTLEWHRSTSGEKPINKASAGINSELFFGDISKSAVAPYLLFKVEGTNDFENDKTTTKIATFLSLQSLCNFGPGARTVKGGEKNGCVRIGGSRIGQYFPYVGIEYFDNLPIEKNGEILVEGLTEWFATARFRVEWYPFNRSEVPLAGRFEITAEYTYRKLLGSSARLEDSFDLFTVGVNYYFDEKRRFGIGYSLEDGESPVNNFDDRRTASITLRAKI